jgi:Fe-S cluster biogenesis protein NfuA
LDQASPTTAHRETGGQVPPADDKSSLFIAIRKVIDQDVRPYVQADGGDIELLAVEGNVVKVKLLGACVTCPSSLMTLRQGVEARLKAKIHPDLVVQESK